MKIAIVKRSLCFSLGPVSLELSVLPKDFIRKYSRMNRVWGLCGTDSTRANKATDSLFILCNQQGKHFVAVAIASFSRSEQSPTGFVLTHLDTNKASVDALLQEMIKEKEAYCEGKKRREKGITEADQQPRKKRHRAVERAVEQQPGIPAGGKSVSFYVDVRSSFSEETASIAEEPSTSEFDTNRSLLDLLGKSNLPASSVVAENCESDVFFIPDSTREKVFSEGACCCCSCNTIPEGCSPSLLNDDDDSVIYDCEPLMDVDWTMDEVIH